MRKTRRVVVVVVSLSAVGAAVIVGSRMLHRDSSVGPTTTPRTPAEVVDAWHSALVVGDATRVRSLSCAEVSTYIEGLISNTHHDQELRDQLNRRHITGASAAADRALVTVVYDLWRDGSVLHRNVSFTLQLVDQNG
ncbi:hypothetical protein K7711_46485 [Nocardia sp. CA2R105]|uniref:hypothetical protein n=1 Tax=Nocardia coffeae TaxID=2873381 RepID=UPI001CA6528E|nr:hypothetical protein [Nocardia coffeae]MBY8863980.1 hypothetical protein [Nocardia coffeae]